MIKKNSPKENQLTIRTISDCRITTSTKYNKKNVPFMKYHNILRTKRQIFSLFSHLSFFETSLFLTSNIETDFFSFHKKLASSIQFFFFVSPTNKTRVFTYFFLETNFFLNFIFINFYCEEIHFVIFCCTYREGLLHLSSFFLFLFCFACLHIRSHSMVNYIMLQSQSLNTIDKQN